MGSLGEQLRAARTAMSKSLDDISNSTNISKPYLKALEDDDYSIFPARVYIRGFLGVYAKYLGMAPETLTDQYDKSTMLHELSDRDTSKDTSEKTLQEPRARRTTLRRLIPFFVVLAVIICLAVFLWLQRDQFI